MSDIVLAYSENLRVSNETASAAAWIQGADTVVIDIGAPRDGTFAPAKKLVLKGAFSHEDLPEVTAEVLAREFKRVGASVLLIGGTRDGRDVAARVAAKLGVGCLSDLSKVQLSDGTLSGERSAFAGKVTARVECPIPAVATVKAGVYPQIATRASTVEDSVVGAVESRSKVVSRLAKEPGSVDLKSAKTIVSAGRGVKRKEDLAMLEDLAKEMHGALGCSRPLSSDLGWLPEEHHIGLTGVNVKPDLYLALGISGQLQHIAGIKDSKIIAAVNTDKDAPIFQASDYGIVGDLYLVVPALRKALAARR